MRKVLLWVVDLLIDLLITLKTHIEGKKKEIYWLDDKNFCKKWCKDNLGDKK